MLHTKTVRDLEGNSKRITTMTFFRFGIKKMVQFQADTGQELSFFARTHSGIVVRMTREAYLELPDYEQ